MMSRRYFFCILLLLSTLTTKDVAAHSSDCVYTIYVKTGNKTNAGTRSKISFSLGDYLGKSFEVSELEKWGKMDSNHNYFQHGNFDIFVGKAKCLSPPMCKLKLSSNGEGHNPKWFVDYIDVTLARAHETCSNREFKINKWIGVNGDWNVDLDLCKKHL